MEAGKWGVGVLIDFHGVPGGANKDIHSGTDSGKAEFWTNVYFQELHFEVIAWATQKLKEFDNVIGIGLINEAEWAAGEHGMYEWYAGVQERMTSIDATQFMVISDAWNLTKAADWAMSRNQAPTSDETLPLPSSPVVIDHHNYYTFAPEYYNKKPQEIMKIASKALSELDGKEGAVKDRGAVEVIVGEYSNTLSEHTWSNLEPGDPSREELVRQFGMTQMRRYEEMSGGCYFWMLDTMV